MSMINSRQLMFAALAVSVAGGALASSHREAPFISTRPSVDGTDFYMFNSYESGRAGYVTLIANYVPLQDPQGGPNYFALDDNALYEISVDNTGSGKANLTFQFRFTTTTQGLTVPVGTKSVPVSLINIGPVSAGSTGAQNVAQTYTLTLVKGDRRTGTVMPITNATSGSATFAKPLDNIGNKSIANYAPYAGTFVHPISIPGCGGQGKVFVGQRQDPFFLDLGGTFDLVNYHYPVEQLVPAGMSTRNYGTNSLAGFNVTSLALEIPAACLTNGSDPVIGGYTTASLRQASVLNPKPESAKSAASVGRVTSPTEPELAGGSWSQVSRLLRDQSVLAPIGTGPVRQCRRRGAERVSANRPGSGIPHRYRRSESAGEGARSGGRTALEHDYGRDAVRLTKGSGRARRRFGRLPQRSTTDRRRGRHHAACRHGRAAQAV